MHTKLSNNLILNMKVFIILPIFNITKDYCDSTHYR